jgi:hypothetical protein
MAELESCGRIAKKVLPECRLLQELRQFSGIVTQVKNESQHAVKAELAQSGRNSITIHNRRPNKKRFFCMGYFFIAGASDYYLSHMLNVVQVKNKLF